MTRIGIAYGPGSRIDPHLLSGFGILHADRSHIGQSLLPSVVDPNPNQIVFSRSNFHRILETCFFLLRVHKVG